MSNSPGLAARMRARAAECPTTNKLDWLRGLLGDEAVDLDDILKDVTVPPTAVWRELVAWWSKDHDEDFPITLSAVTQWARKARTNG